MTAQFDDGKDSGAFRTIGELAQALGIKPHVLRYWEQHFVMLQPLKRSGGRRYYRPEDVALVERIDRLVNREGYTLKGAMKALSGKDIGGRGSVGEGVSQPGELPLDSGVDAFFGRPSPVSSAGRETTTAAPQASDETLARLKSIRNRLADALEG